MELQAFGLKTDGRGSKLKVSRGKTRGRGGIRARCGLKYELRRDDQSNLKNLDGAAEMNDHDRKAEEHAESAGGYMERAKKRAENGLSDPLLLAQIEVLLSIEQRLASLTEAVRDD